MLIEVDFNSDEAIYIQLCNQIILGIAMSDIQEGGFTPICQTACRYGWSEYAYCEQSVSCVEAGRIY